MPQKIQTSPKIPLSCHPKKTWNILDLPLALFTIINWIWKFLSTTSKFSCSFSGVVVGYCLFITLTPHYPAWRCHHDLRPPFHPCRVSRALRGRNEPGPLNVRPSRVATNGPAGVAKHRWWEVEFEMINVYVYYIYIIYFMYIYIYTWICKIAFVYGIYI